MENYYGTMRGYHETTPKKNIFEGSDIVVGKNSNEDSIYFGSRIIGAMGKRIEELDRKRIEDID